MLLLIVEAVLTDYSMGRENGLAFAKRFHEKFPSVPVIIITAFAPAALSDQIDGRGDITLLHKPVDYDQLLRVLDDKRRP